MSLKKVTKFSLLWEMKQFLDENKPEEIYFKEETVNINDQNYVIKTLVKQDLNIKEIDLKTEREVKFIYHISDIHIRLFERHLEFQEIFNKLYDKLNEEKNKEQSIIVLTGDLFHSKNHLSPESIIIAINFLTKLSEIMDVIMIAGNHDVNLGNSTRMDSITSILYNKKSNIYYLKDTGIYHYGNITFSVTSVFDENIIRAYQLKNQRKYKIALYHGNVGETITDVGHRLHGEFSIEDFKNYDFVLLGDVHRFQYMNDNKTIAYASSLIQQNFGESINNHGLIKWNLETKESEYINLVNEYGFYTVNVNNGIINDNELMQVTKSPRIKFLIEETTQSQLNTIINTLKTKYDIQQISKDFKLPSLIKSSDIQVNMLGKETQNVLITEYLKKKKISDNDIKKILEINDILNNDIKKNQQFDNHRWKLISLKFSNMFSYGENNIIHFSKMENIIGILAPNYHGKSSLLDVILFCIFDKCSRGERKEVLNIKKNKFNCSIVFEIGNIAYHIDRTGERQRDSVKVDVNFWKELSDGSLVSLNGIDRVDTNKKIIKILGRYEDFISTTISLQNNNDSFMDMTQTKRKDFLNELLQINIFDELCQKAKDNRKDINSQLKMLTQHFTTDNLVELQTTKTQHNQKLIILNDEINKIRIDISKINDKIVQINKRFKLVIDVQNNIKELERIKNELNDKIDNIKNNIKIINNKNKQNEQIIMNTKLGDEKNIKEKHNIFMNNNKNNIQTLQENINKLYGLIVPNINEINIDELIIEKDNINNKIKLIKEKINNFVINQKQLNDNIKNENNIIKNHNIFNENMKNIIGKLNDEINELVNNKKHIQIFNKDIKQQEKSKEFKNNEISKLQILISENEIKLNDSLNKQKEITDELKQYTNITNEINNYNELNDKFDSIENELSFLNEQIRTKKELENKLNKYEYNPNCEYCVKNEFVQMAKKAQLELPELLKSKNKLEKESNEINNKLDETICDKYQKYCDLIEIKKSVSITVSELSNIKLKYEKNMMILEKEYTEIDVFITNYNSNENNKQNNKKIEEQIIMLKKEIEKEKNKIDEEYENLLDTKDELINLNNEILFAKKDFEIMNNKLNIICNSEKQYYLNKEIIEQNKLNNIKIIELKKKIDEINESEDDEYNIYVQNVTKIEKLKHDILDNNNLLLQLENQLLILDQEIIKISDKIILIRQNEENKIFNMDIENELKQINNERNDMMEKEKQIIEDITTNKTDMRGIELKIKEVQRNMQLMDDCQYKLKIYGYYIESIQKDGIPYQLLKNYIPVIEQEINKILLPFVSFSIKFVLDSNDIKLDIIQQNKLGYSAQLVSGFEKFIISLAVRIALTNLSILPKPNFIAIDEGWGCFDSTNIANISNIFDYLRTKFDFVLVVSHITELQSDVDDIININIIDGFSKIEY